MDRIDQLLLRAKQAIPGRGFLTVAFIDQCDDKFLLAAHLWDGVKFSGVVVLKSTHDTQEEVMEALAKLEELYANRKHQALVLIDLGKGE